MNLMIGVFLSILGLEMAVYSAEMARSLVGLVIMISGWTTILWSPE